MATSFITAFAHHLKDMIVSTKTQSRHILVIDGLDDVLLAESSTQLAALSALILEASRLNQVFRQHDGPFKILILCRTDIYERLPGPNQNKIRQDLALELTWFEESGDVASSQLVALANIRARHFDRHIRDVFSQFFPRPFHPHLSGLLDNTRHTPRDFRQLLRYIQESQDGDVLVYRHIRAGGRAYCQRYFLPEIRDELDGVIEKKVVDRFFEILRQLHKSEFTLSEVQAAVQGSQHASGVDLETMLPALFNAGAIGNVFFPNPGDRRRTFRYRNPGSQFNWSDTICAHAAIQRALQLAPPGQA